MFETLSVWIVRFSSVLDLFYQSPQAFLAKDNLECGLAVNSSTSHSADYAVLFVRTSQTFCYDVFARLARRRFDNQLTHVNISAVVAASNPIYVVKNIDNRSSRGTDGIKLHECSYQ